MQAGLHFFYTNIEGEISSITGSSIHDCNGICIYAELADHVLIDNNVIYKGVEFLIKTVSITNWQISNNILLSVMAGLHLTVAMEF